MKPTIDYNRDRVTLHVTWRELLWLPRLGRIGTEREGLNSRVLRNLRDLAAVLEQIRDLFPGRAIIIHCAWRPEFYNKMVGGAPRSAHIEGLAADFHVQGIDCDEVRRVLKPLLAKLKIRVEDLPGVDWVHVDRRQVADSCRYFKP